MLALTDDDQTVLGEFVVRHLQIERGRSLPDATGRVVVGTVARTVVSTEVTGVGNRDTTQVSADTDHDQPFGVLDTFLQMEITVRENILY